VAQTLGSVTKLGTTSIAPGMWRNLKPRLDINFSQVTWFIPANVTNIGRFWITCQCALRS
jgi:hypothetical protein